MQYFANCSLCELTVLGSFAFILGIIFIGVDYYRYKKRKYGENPPKMWKKS